MDDDVDNATTERRVQLLHDRVLLIEQHIEIEQANQKQIASMRRMLAGFAFSFAITALVSGTAAIFAWGEINAKLNAMDFSALNENFVISRSVLKDQSKQLGDMVGSQGHFQEQLDKLREEVKIATRDRYFRTDARDDKGELLHAINQLKVDVKDDKAEMLGSLAELRHRMTRNESFIFSDSYTPKIIQRKQ